MQLFAFGHSIVQGFWDTDGGWVQRLRSDLDAMSLDESDERYFEVYNLGVSGNDSSQLLARFNTEIEHRVGDEEPPVILFQIGANDIQYLREEDRIRVPLPTFEENVGKLIEQARTFTDALVFVGEGY